MNDEWCIVRTANGTTQVFSGFESEGEAERWLRVTELYRAAKVLIIPLTVVDPDIEELIADRLRERRAELL